MIIRFKTKIQNKTYDYSLINIVTYKFDDRSNTEYLFSVITELNLFTSECTIC